MKMFCRRFLDNKTTGKCSRCGKMPESKEIPFLVLKIKDIPCTSLNVSLISVVQSYLSESSEVTSMQYSHVVSNKSMKRTIVIKLVSVKIENCREIQYNQVSRILGNSTYWLCWWSAKVDDLCWGRERTLRCQIQCIWNDRCC